MSVPLKESTRPASQCVGIVGGGQLARMMAEAASNIGLEITVLDPTPACPAAEFATQLVGEFDDERQLAVLAHQAAVVTLDIEAVSAHCLETLERNGTRVAPAARVLAIIQDKLRQKEFLAQHGFPTSPFCAVTNQAELAAFELPCIVKARRHGYDGRGVKRVTSHEDALEMLKTPCLAERLVEIDKELAIMVARNWRGEVVTYPVVEAEFDARANILDVIKAPAAVPSVVAARCEQLAREIVIALDGVGIFGIEFFLDRAGQVLVNEISPRPHNSGHYTIEACATSQFEQHLRAVAGLPLGSASLRAAAVSFNLLGALEADGTPVYEGLNAAQAMPGVAVHLYGKHRVKPFRKMGHVTVTSDTLDHAVLIAQTLRASLRVTSE